MKIGLDVALTLAKYIVLHVRRMINMLLGKSVAVSSIRFQLSTIIFQLFRLVKLSSLQLTSTAFALCFVESRVAHERNLARIQNLPTVRFIAFSAYLMTLTLQSKRNS